MNDQEKSEERLREEVVRLRRMIESFGANESRFRSLVENSSDLIWEMDQRDVLTYISPKIEEFLGYEPAEVIGKTPFELMPPEEAERVRKATEAINEPFTGVEATFLHKDGRTVVLEANGERILDGDGNFIGFRGVSRDVTERREIEEALRQSEERYRQIFNSIADSLLVGDLESRVVAANPAACTAHGYTEEEIVGLPVTALIHPDNHHKFEALLGHIETGDTFRVESVDVRKDGSTFDVEVFGRPFVFKGKPHLMAIVRDISERKKAERELRQNEETARALINAPTESFLLIEPDGTVVTLNETAAKRLGGSVGTLVGKCVYEHLPAGVDESRRAHVEQVVRSGEPICFKDRKEERYYQSCVYPVKEHGQVVKLAIYAQDITDQKKAEKAVLEEQERLRHSLEASDRERRLIAYDIHDGLAQHLTAAIMQFQTFEQLKSNDAKEVSEIFESGLGLLDQALAEARRLIGGVRPPILDEMGIVAAVTHLVADVERKGGPTIDVDIDVEFDRLAPTLENTLFRIIQESLANACIHSESEKAGLMLAQHGEDLFVEIQDWGTGFDLENVREGSFGLESICERARLVGGDAVIESRPGVGTNIAVKVPLPEAR